MHKSNGEIGIGFCKKSILLYFFSVDIINQIFLIGRHGNAVCAIGVIKKGQRCALNLLNFHRLLFFLVFINAQNTHPRIAFPEMEGMLHAGRTHIQHVIGCMQHHIKARHRQTFSHIRRGVKERIAGIALFFQCCK